MVRASDIQVMDLIPIHRIHKNDKRTRARHFRTDRIFVHGFLPFKEEPGISFSQRKTEDIVCLLITLSTILFSILKCLDSMLPITHSRPLLRVRHFYGVLRPQIFTRVHYSLRQDQYYFIYPKVEYLFWSTVNDRSSRVDWGFLTQDNCISSSIK